MQVKLNRPLISNRDSWDALKVFYDNFSVRVTLRPSIIEPISVVVKVKELELAARDQSSYRGKAGIKFVWPLSLSGRYLAELTHDPTLFTMSFNEVLHLWRMLYMSYYGHAIYAYFVEQDLEHTNWVFIIYVNSEVCASF